MGSFVKIPRGNEQTSVKISSENSKSHENCLRPGLCTHFIPKGISFRFAECFPLSRGTILQSKKEKKKDLLTLPSEGAFLQVDCSVLCSVCLQFNKEVEM